MNFNANSGPKQPFGRKIKRVSDVNAMGYNPYTQPQPFPNGQDAAQPQPAFNPQHQPAQEFNQSYTQPNNVPYNNFDPNQYANVPGIGVFAQPMVQNMAMQYTQQLANTGTTMVKKEIERFVPVNRLKYYFAVDTKYVLTKLGLLFFPFTHADWSVKYEQDGPVQPRFEINAPDLYIPTMAYVTYVLVAGLVLGMQQRFSPEQIGIQSSSALAWCLIELGVYNATLYISNIQTSLRTLDLLAYSGYKFVGLIVSILLSIVGGSTAYFCMLGYFSLALAFFLVRSLRAQVLPEISQQEAYYGDNVPSSGNKRRLYFLLFVAAAQPVLSWWLSYHLIRYTPSVTP